jgi:hypothetical protein
MLILLLKEQPPMHVALAQPADIPTWLELAAEVEFLEADLRAHQRCRIADFSCPLDNHAWRPTILLACLEHGRDGAHL